MSQWEQDCTWTKRSWPTCCTQQANWWNRRTAHEMRCDTTVHSPHYGADTAVHSLHYGADTEAKNKANIVIFNNTQQLVGWWSFAVKGFQALITVLIIDHCVKGFWTLCDNIYKCVCYNRCHDTADKGFWTLRDNIYDVCVLITVSHGNAVKGFFGHYGIMFMMHVLW
jgi:hypothetical protein